MTTLMDRRISDAYCYGTRKELEEIQAELLNSRKKVGEFIDLFLEKFDEQMSHPLTKTDDPKWKLFRAKHAEYGELERLITAANYFLAKA